MNKLVVALVGPPLAGKGKFVEAIEDWCGKNRVGRHCSGDIIRDILKKIGQPQDRPHCARLVSALVEECGSGVVSSAIRNRICRDHNPVVIFDSMRLLDDERMVASLGAKALRVYITAPAEIRYKRLSERRRDGEEHLSFEKFCLNDQLPTERLIHKIGSRADVTITSGDNYAENDAKRLQFCQTHLAKYAFA